MAELLLELLSEEIPARMQANAANELVSRLRATFDDAGVGYVGARAFTTPRRITVVAEHVAPRQANRTIERRGPRVDAPDHAHAGFIRSIEDTSFRLEEREEKKGKFLYAIVEEIGLDTTHIVNRFVNAVLQEFPWPKSMRWGRGETRWVRPLHSILCIFNGEPQLLVIPFKVENGLMVAWPKLEFYSAELTAGHRFLAPQPLSVRNFSDYREKLLAAKVILDASERRQRIEDGARALAERQGLRLRHDPALLAELAGLVEWPVPLMGRIDRDFMDLPEEVLVLIMRQNQKYLALETADGKLADRFVVVANIEALDGGAAIVAGNERVLRARLWDARFFWEQDRKRPLESLLPKLDRMVFHAELGTQGQRVERLVALTGALVPFVPGCDRTLAERAALLAKADLVSGMVGEFPELQGIMGGHYARAQGEPEAVAAAIGEQYSPKGPDDRCPRSPESVAVALADRLDALTGFFAKGIRPTGTRDPFALRRAALGVIRPILENRLRLPLRAAIAAAASGHGVAAPTDALLAFFGDRLRVHLRGQGVRHDLVAAVFAKGDDDLVRLLTRVEALGRFIASDDGRNLLVAYRRASNIVGIEEKRDGRSYDGQPVAGLLREPAERELGALLVEAIPAVEATLAAEDFEAAMRTLSGLRAPIDRFFDQILVNASERELRVNRLRMLAQLRAALGAVADFSLIEEAAA